MEYGKQESQIDREPWDLSYVCRQTSLVSRDPSRGGLGIHGICSASVNPFVSSYDAAGKQLVRAFCPAAAAMTSLQYSTQSTVPKCHSRRVRQDRIALFLFVSPIGFSFKLQCAFFKSSLFPSG